MTKQRIFTNPVALKRARRKAERIDKCHKILWETMKLVREIKEQRNESN
jgi:hypothetical protein